MKKLIVIAVILLATCTFAWPVITLNAAGTTVVVKITEAQLNKGVPLTDSFGTVSKLYADIQEGRLAFSGNVKTTRGTARVVIYIKATVQNGQMFWNMVSATVNGKAVPASIVKKVNQTYAPMIRINIASYLGAYSGYKIKSVRMTRNTIFITLSK